MTVDFADIEVKRHYDAAHKWIRYYYGKASQCEKCQSPGRKYQWSNKSRLYKRDRSDWQELCISCHIKFDRTVLTTAKQRAKNGHMFMGAGETASELLEDAGYITVNGIGEILKDNGDSEEQRQALHAIKGGKA